MNALSLLCECIAQGGKATAKFGGNDNFVKALLRLGYLREAGLVSSVVCQDCEEPHAAPLVFEDGRYGHYCPDLGFVALDRASLRAVSPDLQRLVARLADRFECRRRRAAPLRDRTWRIGDIETEAGSGTLYFHPVMQSEDDVRDLDHALSREVRSHVRLIITARGTLPLPGAQVVQLDDLAGLNPDTGVLHILSHPADVLGLPRKNPGGRPSDHGAILGAIISERLQTETAPDGINEEARVILREVKTRYPGRPAPSLSTVKRHLAKLRGGS